MQEFLAFAAVVIIVSASGVMMPGPMFAASIFYGVRGGLAAGIRMAAGHTVVELPLVVLLGAGVLSLESFPESRAVISLVGAASLFAFAALQIRTAFGPKQGKASDPRHGAFFAGVVFSALNPFFIVWWATIGFKLIADALEMWSMFGIVVMFGLHIWMDYAWLAAVGAVSKKGGVILSGRNHRILVLALAGLMIYFGAGFLAEAL